MINKFNSKAGNLLKIKELATRFTVPKLLAFTVVEFNNNPDEICKKINNYFHSTLIAVRSSTGDEDTESNSAAGQYESILNIPSDDKSEVLESITSVIKSYEKLRKCNGKDEFIIQEMVQNPSCSGVVFTHELNTGAPYYVINYDDVSGLTHTVTSGDGEYANRTLYVHRGALSAVRSERFKTLLDAIAELEVIMGSQFLDIEFALDEELTPYLFQVRAITTLPNWNRGLSNNIELYLEGIKRFVEQRFKPVSGVFGKTTVLSQMSDWNPAEIIGRAPRALAFSLYKRLVTDSAWSLARKKMGYNAPNAQHLMVSLAGQPFIDARLSFHSYLPKGLSANVSEKLVNTWVEKLRNKPELHDKIEFDVAITTYSFDLDERLSELPTSVLSKDEILSFKKLLHAQTVDLVNGSSAGSIESALKSINKLEQKQFAAYPRKSTGCISHLLELASDCYQLGTVPFAILARHGFIAKTLLLSLQRKGILTTADIEFFQASIRTVASELVEDIFKMESGQVTLKDILTRYGHLRPGTYDILSCRYDQMENFGKEGHSKLHHKQHKVFELSEDKKQKINLLLEENQFQDVDVDNLFDYFREAITGREYSKFVFTKSVSNMLELIANFGEEHGLSREEMSHIPLEAITYIASNSKECSTEDYLRNISKNNAEKHGFSVAIRLPQVLFDLEGIYVVPFQVSQPNFITNKKITALKKSLSTYSYSKELTGNIVLIENADPGFDWIFSQNIAGLVTKYGGANSHMAIRCAEFAIPAAIGCGEQRFESLLKAKYILLDAGSGLVKSLH